MPAHSRSENGVAEPVIGPATSGRTRWLAYVAGIHVLDAALKQDVEGRNKSGHDEFDLFIVPRPHPSAALI
jgi:hypothetical protein